jgi:hypothetical protein
MQLENRSSDLIDIRSITIDKNLSKQERIAEYIRQVKNPYRFKCGDFVISVRYSDHGPTLDECLQRLLT